MTRLYCLRNTADYIRVTEDIVNIWCHYSLDSGGRRGLHRQHALQLFWDLVGKKFTRIFALVENYWDKNSKVSEVCNSELAGLRIGTVVIILGIYVWAFQCFDDLEIEIPISVFLLVSSKNKKGIENKICLQCSLCSLQFCTVFCITLQDWARFHVYRCGYLSLWLQRNRETFTIVCELILSNINLVNIKKFVSPKIAKVQNLSSPCRKCYNYF